MAKRNKGYWQSRAEQKVLDCEKMILDYEKRMKSAFFDAVKDLDKEIIKLYVKYAKDNKLSYSETLKYLRNDERLEFQKGLKWYIEHAENPKYRREHRQELQALSVRARVKRIEQMKANIIMQSERLFQKLQNGSLNIFEQVYEEAYYRTAFDTFQGFGMGEAFSRPAEAVVSTLLHYPWSGKSYSGSLWDLEKGFVDGLNRVMTAGLIRGQSVLEMSKALRDEALGRDFGKGKAGGQLSKAQRLVRTEANFVLNQATADMYEELEVEQYEFLGTLDSLTCSHCGGLDGKHYPVGEEKAGVNYPPLHPYCRCTTVPYFPEDEDDPGTRIARDADGKNYHVPADMTYQEWREGLREKDSVLILSDSRYRLLPKEIMERIRQDEEGISWSVVEHMIIYDENGKMIAKLYGNATSVKIPGISLEGCIITHNHPSGHSFSPEDIQCLFDTRAAEIRVTTQDGTYKMRQPKKKPARLNRPYKIRKEYERILESLRAKYLDILRNDSVPLSKVETLWINETLRIFCKENDIDYDFERR